MASGHSSPDPYPMSGGDGPNSYFQNSVHQKSIVEATREMINEAIQDKLALNSPSNAFNIADFGCSVGPNTFIAVQNIIEAVELKYHGNHQNHQSLEFQVFFNDHTNNDFNTLFKNLHHNHPRKFFVAGVPGTFHGRLFPKSSLHFGHSSFALQWLSKTPSEVLDTKSPAWNKGSIHCTGFHTEVAEAYSSQFKNDMETFLNARAQELVNGGLLVIIMPALQDGVLLSQSSIGVTFELLGSCLQNMAQSGIISQEKVEAFNLPIYISPAKDLEALLQRNGFFSVEKIDRITSNMNTSTLTAQFLTSQLRAVTEELIKGHFGSEIVDAVFELFNIKLSENWFSIMDTKNQKFMDLFIILRRNFSD